MTRATRQAKFYSSNYANFELCWSCYQDLLDGQALYFALNSPGSYAHEPLTDTVPAQTDVVLMIFCSIAAQMKQQCMVCVVSPVHHELPKSLCMHWCVSLACTSIDNYTVTIWKWAVQWYFTVLYGPEQYTANYALSAQVACSKSEHSSIQIYRLCRILHPVRPQNSQYSGWHCNT